MLKLIWRPDAERQLLDIVDYIGARNAPAAVRIKALIDDRIELARVVPGMGRPDRVTGTRELFVHPNYIVVYLHDGEALNVLQVLHARQRYP